MPINERELLSAAQELSENQNLRICVKESIKGGFIAGGGALLGGLLGGPIGLAIGGTIGSVYAACKSSGKFKAVALVITEDMTPQQRTRLADSLRKAVENVQVEDAVMLAGLLMTNQPIQKVFITQLCNFLRDEMGLAIAN